MFLDHFPNHHSATFGDDVYFSPNGCKGRRLKENLVSVNAIFADFDFKPQEVTGDMKAPFKQFMLDLEDLPTPTFVVESGNGWHVYWCLEEPIAVDDTNREDLIKQVEGMHRYLSQEYGADSGAIDVLHLLRKPGFEHKKMPEHPVMVEVVVDNSDTKYEMDELLKAMPPVYKVEQEVGTNADDDFDIRQVATDVWAELGDTVTFDNYGRMVWNGKPTGTFIGREGGGNYIATTSEEYPHKGNATTYVAGVLGITTREAYRWLIGKYGDLGQDEAVQDAKTKTKDIIDERERYLEFLSTPDWDDKDWVKKLKSLSDRYFINFYKRIAQLYPNLRYEVGRLDTFWDYNESEGVYEEMAQSTLAGVVIRALREDYMDNYTTDAQVKRIILNFCADPSRGVNLDDFSVPSGWLHVKNGWLDLTTKELHPHSPERLSLFKMDTDYDPTATCPLYDKFLDVDTQMKSDQVRVIDQFSGYILTDGIEQHTCLILEGRKGCGKSMLLEIWMNMLGNKAIPLQLTSLQNGGERFIGQTLAHKNLCWFDEANPRTSNINEFFQNLITGEKIRIERKGVQGDDYVRNTMKVVLSLNEMPDHMPVGMDRRYRHIVFHRSFYEEGIVEPNYKRNVLENEKSGVLNRMLRGLDDMRKMRGLTMIAGEEERKREYALTSDDFSSFLSDHFEQVPIDAEVRYPGKVLRDAFVAEYPKGYNKQLTVRGFNKKLLATRLPEFKNITTGKSGSVRGYKGIKLKEGHELPTESWEPIQVQSIQKEDW